MSKIIYPTTTQSSFEDFLNEIEKFYKDKYQKTYREYKEQIRDAEKHSSTNEGRSALFCCLMLVAGITALVLWVIRLGMPLCGMPLFAPIIASVLLAVSIPLDIVFSKKQDHWDNIASEYEDKIRELVDKICSELDEIKVYVGENTIKCSLYSDEYFYVESCENDCYKAFKVINKIKDEEDVRVDKIIADDDLMFNVYINDIPFETHTFATPTNRTYFNILTRKSKNNIFDFTYLDDEQHKREEAFKEIKRR